MQKQKILVVGGAGFIGHNVALKLERLGHEVTILDNFTNYGIVDEEFLGRLHHDRLEHFKGMVIDGDIRNMHDCNKINTIKPDCVIHLASHPRAKIVNMDPRSGSDTMVNGLLNVLDSCVNNHVKRFVYISSSMIYGDFDNGINESATPKPGSIYASLKLAGEHITKQYANLHNFDYTIVRPSAVYGPLDVEDRVVGKFLINAMTDKDLVVHGEQEKLDFSYVGDVANGICLSALHDNAANEIFNITFGQDEFINDAAYMMCAIANRGRVRVVNKNGDMPSRGYLDIKRAINKLGYNPLNDIETGFKIYYDWAKKFYSI